MCTCVVASQTVVHILTISEIGVSLHPCFPPSCCPLRDKLFVRIKPNRRTFWSLLPPLHACTRFENSYWSFHFWIDTYTYHDLMCILIVLLWCFHDGLLYVYYVCVFVSSWWCVCMQIYLYISIHMCRYIYVYVCIYIYMYMFINVSIRTHIHSHSLTHADTNTHTHTYTSIYTYIYTYIWGSTRHTYIYIYLYVYEYVFIYKCMWESASVYRDDLIKRSKIHWIQRTSRLHLESSPDAKNWGKSIGLQSYWLPHERYQHHRKNKP